MGLKEIPLQFSIDSEEDIRVMVISFFTELGFDRDEISCEDYFSIHLGHQEIEVNRKNIGGRSDILVSRNGQPLAIVETKTPSHKIEDDDAWQAISYARLLSAIAPFAIVTNGGETKVYDVLASKLTPIDNSHNSIWFQNGQHVSALGDEIRYEATKFLIGINADVLGQFCMQQVTLGLADLKSNLNQNKKYIPELYVERRLLNEAFMNWMKSERSIFAVVGQSGYGKTNFMCAKVEEIDASQFSLFYNASRFTNGLVQAITSDFFWEFHREKNIVHIFDRLDQIAKNADKKLIIFLDAIDENPTGIVTLKNELLELTTRIQKYPNIKLVISCKTFDWPYVVIDGNQAFNCLAETINPSIINPETRLTTPDAKQIGFHLEEFTAEELEEAITKYKNAYLLKGDFGGELLKESHNPLLLRFISEIYGGREELPTSISSLELFNLYWQRKSEPIENPGISETILSRTASLIFDSGTRGIPKDQIRSDLAWSDGYDKSLKDLFRLGVLAKTNIEELEIIGFEFNKFLLFYYIFKVKKFQVLPLADRVICITELVKTKIGIEALEFYLTIASQDAVNELLKHLASQNLLLCTNIITELAGIKNYEKSPIPIEHISNYLEFYNFLRDNFFERLSYSIMPYSKMPLGVIFTGDVPVLFRACTSTVSQPIVRIDDKQLIKELFKGPISRKLQTDLMPVGSFHIGGIHEFSKHPQAASYKHLVSEIGSALSHKMLDESSAPEVLKERIYSILFYEPSIWLQGDDFPPHDHYWKLMGYKDIQEAEEAKIVDLLKQTDELINKIHSHLERRNSLYPSYLRRTNQLLAMYFALSKLNPEDHLGHPPYSIDKLWNYLRGPIDPFIDEVKNLIPYIIQNYKLLFSQNFPSLIQYSDFYSNIDKLAIVEIVRSSGFSDFLALSYIVCPSIVGNKTIKVIYTSEGHSLTEKLYFKSLWGEGYSVSSDSGCGFIELNMTIENEHIYEPQAQVIKTRFPSRTPIIDQAYSLISSNIKSLLNANHLDWRDSYSDLVNDDYLRFAASSIVHRVG
ncbi:MAG TPA: type I restriction enzyme HsdR N-terminal domain-containing protein [Candidatus Cloacimonadota bacterium]|nr:type I restriction enzyme HsdR N-terminal domain-containing protein [Candidatus Cloacimonadota bacterium]